MNGERIVVLLSGGRDSVCLLDRAVREAASDEVLFPGPVYDPPILQALRFHARAYLHGHTVGGTNPSLVEALWAGNAVVGRLVTDLVPPITLNFLRWAVAFVLLLPLGAWVLRRGSGLWSHWKRYAVLGLLGVGCYNALQYLALKTSTPLNVTLVAASTKSSEVR